MEGIETLAVFEEKLAITPRDLANHKINISGLILSKLAEKLEGKCSLHGWVIPGSTKVLSRSMGYLEKGRFTGDLVFHVQAQASVLNPPSGSHLIGEVTGNNMMGMYVTYKVPKKEEDRKTKKVVETDIDAIKIILPRDLHIGDEAFSKVEIGDKVHMEIKKSRFQVNDAFILSVGVFEGKVNSGYAAPKVKEEEEVEVREVGPSEEATRRLQVFEEESKKAEAEEKQKKEAAAGFVIENNVSDMPALESIQATTATTATTETTKKYDEPVYFNAAKIQTFKELDNRYPAKFTEGGKEWPTVEHYYQAMKFPELPEFQEEIRRAPTALAASKLGKTKDPTKPIRADWKEERVNIMRVGISSKFNQNPALKQILLDTYPRPLVFADSNDGFWGYGRTQQGQNMLGKLLTTYRSSHVGMESLDG